MITEQLAERSFRDYRRTIESVRKDRAPVYEDTARVALRGDGLVVNENLFQAGFGQWDSAIREPRQLYSWARTHVQKLLDGREDHLKPDQINRLAAVMCAEDVAAVENVVDDPGLRYAESGKICYFNLPDSACVGAQPKSRTLDLGYRDVAQYVGPKDGTIRGAISNLIARHGQIELLDAGAGGGRFCNTLKGKFGDKLWTTGVGLENTALPIDEYDIRPMEVLPAEWDNRFDVIFSNWALCYAIYPKLSIAELLRVLKPERSAFLDVDYEYSFGTHEDKVEELLGIDRRANIDQYRQAYAGLRGYDQVKQTIEAMSDERYRYEVEPAKGRDHRGICVEVKKL